MGASSLKVNYAIMMYDMTTDSCDVSKRLSIREGSIKSLYTYDNNLYAAVSSSDSDYRAASNGDFANSLDYYSGSGYSEASVYKINAYPSDAQFIRRFNSVTHDSGLINECLSVGMTGIILNFKNGYVEEINFNGVTIHENDFGEPVKLVHGIDGNYALKKQYTADLLDENWATLFDRSRFSKVGLNDVGILNDNVFGEIYYFIGGKENYSIILPSDRQEVLYYFFTKDFHLMGIFPGPLLQRFQDISPMADNVLSSSFSLDGYWLTASYEGLNAVPKWNGTPVKVNGVPLPDSGFGVSKTVLINKKFEIPNIQLDIVPSGGAILYLDKKLDNDVIVDAGQFSSTLVLPDSFQLSNAVGSELNTYLSFSAPSGSGYSLDNYVDTVYAGANNSYFLDHTIKYKNGQYYIEVMMYNYSQPVLGSEFEALITIKVNMTIYLINQSSIQLDDDNDGVINANDNCPNTPSGTPVDQNGCSGSSLGLDDQKFETIKVYPNPSSDYIIISGLDTSKVEVFITNIMGTTQGLGSYNAYNDVKISLNRFPVGMYILTVVSSDTGNKKNYKILKN